MAVEYEAGAPRIDLARYELTVGGRRVTLGRQAMELLILLTDRFGELVTREDIVARLWDGRAFVDADGSINAAIRKIRAALGDDPARPRYLETVIGKGYRFVGEIEVIRKAAPLLAVPSVVSVEPMPAPLSASPAVSRLPSPDKREPVAAPAPAAVWTRSRHGLAILSAAVLGLLALAVWGLERWRAGPPLHSIAVLPLANLSGDPAQDYFAAGITDELTTDLAKVSALKVISRSSAARSRASSRPMREIAAELGVDALVEGSVVRSGDRVRVTAQLIDAGRDRYLWAETYERDLGDMLGVQNAIALEVARQVRIRLSSFEQQRLEQSPPVNPGAYDAYLKGRYALSTQRADGLKEGLPAFEQAIALDPRFAPAYAGLADTYSLLVNYGVQRPAEAFPLADAAARKAIELDASSAEGHTALAYPEHHYAWQWQAAEREYRTAIALSPNYSTAHLRYAEYLSSVARHDEAIAEMRRALELDPLSPVNHGNLGRFLYHARRYEEAIAVLKSALALDPARTYARLHLAMSYEQLGRYSLAEQEFRRVTADFGGARGPGVAHFLASTGAKSEARSLADSLRATAGDSDWFLIAGAYAALGDPDAAFDCLRRAYESHDFFLVFLRVHPFMDPLRSDPRFRDIERRMGFPASD
ncbi:MAG TPA: winged helix-turn-helix domain-containing protein [Steroidobacteraceae bacterium]|nr:winged helix-turn-helix domain-containing protein [Steroidobacteraceae bacterium]